MALRIESGMEMQMTTVCRHLPRKSRIIIAGQARRRSTASLTTPEMEARTNTDWSKSGLMVNSGGRVVGDLRQARADRADDIERGAATPAL